MNTAIIGCGLIGRKRALVLDKEDNLIACCDTDENIGKKFASEFKCQYYKNYNDLIDNAELDVIIVAVVNKYIKEIVSKALIKGLNVIAEKPLGRNEAESEEMNSLADGTDLILKTGFNHRFHPGINNAKNYLDKGKIGEILSIRARYGHGGRPGMEKEWRASKDLCGGGELLDQGVHIIDLCRWFAGDVKKVFGVVKTKFWDIEVEDNAFVYMQAENGADIQFNVSWTNWKNIFSFEVYGTDGYLRVEGLGGSYGKETLEIGIRNKAGGKPEVEIIEYPSEDISWAEEWKEFKNAVKEKRRVIGNGLDGHKANQIIKAIYESSRTGKVVQM